MVPIIASMTERTTAATDALLALECAALAVWVLRTRAGPRWRARLWAGVLGLLALVSALGAVAHGLAWAPATVDALWLVLYPLLGALVGAMFVGALADWRGPGALRRAAPWVAVVALAVAWSSSAGGGAFWVFLLYQAVAALATLAIYARLAAGGRLTGARWIVAALVLDLVAAGVQASPWSLTVVVPFDHNGLYHLVVMAAVALLAQGVVQGQRAQAPRRAA